MNAPSIAMVIVAAAVALVTLQPGLVRWPVWRATLTPLASIIGSGFLVAGPILGHTAGNWAWLAMAALCLAGWLFGSAVRHNIRFVEPLHENGSPPPTVALLERASAFALAFAYFVSVAYYLNLFGSFALRAGDVIDPNLTRIVSSGTILILGAAGALRGLGALERVEAGAVGVKLALIGGLLAALLLIDGRAMLGDGIRLRAIEHDTGMHAIGVMLGLVILVQGFETSRYLNAAYDAKTRIRTMRIAQMIATAIYVGFILLATPFLIGRLPAIGGETGIIDMLSPVGAVVAPLIIFAALASQLSAAVADMNGAGGLLADATGGRVTVRLGYATTAAAAVAITWSADIFEIIVYASKAFVIYYALQSALAACVASRPGDAHSWRHAALYAGVTLLAVSVLVFGIPADGAG